MLIVYIEYAYKKLITLIKITGSRGPCVLVSDSILSISQMETSEFDIAFHNKHLNAEKERLNHSERELRERDPYYNELCLRREDLEKNPDKHKEQFLRREMNYYERSRHEYMPSCCGFKKKLMEREEKEEKRQEERDERLKGMVIYAMDSVYIITDEAHRNLYDRMMGLTSASSTWSILKSYALYMDCRLTIGPDGSLVYFVDKIEGNLGHEEFDYWSPRVDPFIIEIRDHQMIVVKGSIDTLGQVLDRLSMNEPVPEFLPGFPLIHEKNNSPYVSEVINAWVMKGCPEAGVIYRLHVNSFVYTGEIYGLCVTHIKCDTVTLDLTGVVKESLHVKDKETGDEWAFTGSPNYTSNNCPICGRLVPDSCHYRKKLPIPPNRTYHQIDPSVFMTLDHKMRAESLINTVMNHFK